MRGETCIAIATFFTSVSLILLIVAHVGEVNTDTVPRKLYMAEVNVTNYGTAFRNGTGINAPGLYTSNVSAPLGEGNGLRQLYSWGIYGFCAFLSPGHSQGTCGNQTFGNGFTPFDVILSDVPEAYVEYTRVLVPDASAFKNSAYLSNLTKSGFDLLFVGTLAAFVALVTGLIRHKVAFLLASFSSIIGSLFLMIGATLWSVAINKAESINRGVVRGATPLGMVMTTGPQLYLFWVAFVMLLVSTVPYTVSCWSFLKR
ncbi:hypothetical protein FRB94_014045 [Tulasnella sp. JGI-2019a]|nr:hypothetical protein FRB93_013971 [Tulasnella sp. JGI-2019a]KAG9007717.1 hypothetical protein FRB94_014045 [Tulasnella sp. JGI-2019a]KAG9034937.1 hypothetical protein FRB95_012353 [Tulasnella sp. JGI-2019a]